MHLVTLTSHGHAGTPGFERHEVVQQELVPTRDGRTVADVVDEFLEDYGWLSSQMREEAETARWQVSRWDGERPMRLLGYLCTLWIDPIPGLRPRYSTASVLEQMWIDARARERREQEASEAHPRQDEIDRLVALLQSSNEIGRTIIRDVEDYATRAVEAGWTVELVRAVLQKPAPSQAV